MVDGVGGRVRYMQEYRRSVGRSGLDTVPYFLRYLVLPFVSCSMKRPS